MKADLDLGIQQRRSWSSHPSREHTQDNLNERGRKNLLCETQGSLLSNY